MAEFEEFTQPYNLNSALQADRGDNCIVIDVGRSEDGYPVKSLNHVLKSASDSIFKGHPDIFEATKLYVIGDWAFSFPTSEAEHLAGEVRDISQPTPTPAYDEWKAGVDSICQLIEQMPNLDELTWVARLPFMEEIWDVLPKTLSKLILDVGRAVKIDPLDYGRASYISPDAMKPLIAFTQLRELRIFNMHDSFQSTIWETVFSNKAEGMGMRVLDLSMADTPLVRQEDWVKGNDVKGGCGEYLDDLCMRRARLASELDETKPLPLWCLKLDGFVVDALPFEHELTRVVLLTCGEHCIDAGLHAPKTASATTLNKWGSSVNAEATHCFIKWPNWAGIFDNEGLLLDPEGHVAAEGNSGKGSGVSGSGEMEEEAKETEGTTPYQAKVEDCEEED